MSEEKIIGVEQEAKVYAIGAYKLTMIPITELNLPEAKKVLAGFASMKQFEDETLIGAFTKVYSKLMKPVLRAEGTTAIAKFLIALRIQTPFRILSSRATLGEVGGIIQDFFVLNYSSNPQSVVSSGNILLNLIRPASPPTSMTSSTT